MRRWDADGGHGLRWIIGSLSQVPGATVPFSSDANKRSRDSHWIAKRLVIICPETKECPPNPLGVKHLLYDRIVSMSVYFPWIQGKSFVGFLVAIDGTLIRRLARSCSRSTLWTGIIGCTILLFYQGLIWLCHRGLQVIRICRIWISNKARLGKIRRKPSSCIIRGRLVGITGQ